MKISRVCSKVELAPAQPENAATVRLNCVIRGAEREAKAGSPRDTAYFDVSKSTGELAGVVVLGSGGVRMEMKFSNWKFDPPAPEALFHFQPDRGWLSLTAISLWRGPGERLN